VLGRRELGFDPNHPLLAAIVQDPWLKDLIHIAEPWDSGLGGYRLGAFPAPWGEWNDHSRDSFRQFWRGDPGSVGASRHGLQDRRIFLGLATGRFRDR